MLSTVVKKFLAVGSLAGAIGSGVGGYHYWRMHRIPSPIVDEKAVPCARQADCPEAYYCNCVRFVGEGPDKCLSMNAHAEAGRCFPDSRDPRNQ
jgi:hypothetical protein